MGVGAQGLGVSGPEDPMSVPLRPGVATGAPACHPVVMDEHDLLLRHAERWASDHGRPLDSELLDEALRLRSTHDGLAANRWPERSVTHLMLVRWPAHGPLDPPDVPALLATLETFWRFLRNTGRMAGGSAEPSSLIREAKSAGRQMVKACADPANLGPSKQMMLFGREIGITLDDVEDMGDANARLAQIMDAWNSLPMAERQRRSPSTGSFGSRMGEAMAEAAGHLLQHGELPAGWAMPDPPRLEDEADDETVHVTDPAISAPLYKASSYLRQVLALCEWVGDGREVTDTDVLRPTVARKAYADLGLWAWERDWLVAMGMELPDGERLDAALARTGLSRWRTAADCLALDRLWLPALNAGLIVIDGKKAVFDRSALPETDEQWAQLAQVLSLGLARVAQHESVLDPLLGILFAIAWENKAPRSEAELADLWWDTPVNWCPTGLTDQERARQLSDQYLQRCLVMFRDTGAWTTRRGKLIGTEVGHDLALVIMSAIEHGVIEGPDPDA